MASYPKIKLLVYGDSGTGKTTLAGSFTEHEETSPVLVLNSRGQPVTFNLFSQLPCIYDIRVMKDYNLPYQWIQAGQPWKVIRKGVEAEDPFSIAVWHYMAEYCDLSPEVLDDDECPIPKFRTLVIDSLTQTQRISLREIAGDLNKLPGDIPSATTYATWGKTLGQLTLLADLYFELDIHVVVTALRRHQFVEAQGLTMYYPFFWGQSANELPSYAEILGMLVPIDSLPLQQSLALKKKELPAGDRPFNVLLLRGSRLHNAKWQGVRNPPDMLVNPTASAILSVLDGTYMHTAATAATR